MMTEEHKKEFINNVCDALKREVIEKTKYFDDWNGLEMMWCLQDLVDMRLNCIHPATSRSRRRAYIRGARQVGLSP